MAAPAVAETAAVRTQRGLPWREPAAVATPTGSRRSPQWEWVYHDGSGAWSTTTTITSFLAPAGRGATAAGSHSDH
jgi:hypothetical protein